MPKLKKDPYAICTNCLHLLTALHFNNSTVCDICLKNKGNK